MAQLRQPVGGGEAGLTGSEDCDPHGGERLQAPTAHICNEPRGLRADASGRMLSATTSQFLARSGQILR
jgi:hypothetical protein